MTPTKVVSAALFLAASFPFGAIASTVPLSFIGPGISANLQLTYGSSTDAYYPQAYEVTGISGTFSDANLGIVDATVGPLIGITNDTPESTNLAAPYDFSRFAVATGLSPENNGFLTYDNLYWPGGSPPTASDYPLHGGVLDIYGLMFQIDGGRVVDLWSNGTITGSGAGPIYGVAVATSAASLDYVGGVTLTPEPNTLVLLASAGLAFLGFKKRSTS